MDALIDLIQRPEFHSGLSTGTIGVAFVLSASVRRRTRPLRIWGLVFTAAAWSAISVSIGWRLSLGIGLAVLALAGLCWDKSRLAAAVTAVAGASMVAWRGGLTDILWIRLGAVVSILLIGIGISRFAQQPRVAPLTVPVFAITLFGVWATVPETEAARIPLGVIAIMGLIAWPWRFAALGNAGAFAMAGLVAWIAAVGGEAREGSIVGAWMSAGLLLTGLHPRLTPRLERLTVLSLQGLVVFCTARVAGFRDDAFTALLLAVPPVLAGVWVLGRQWSPR